MEVRHQNILKLKKETEGKILYAIDDPKKFRDLFKQLIVQAMIKLMEIKVELKVMKKDLKLAREVKEECEKEFRSIVLAECKRDLSCTIVINSDHALEDEIPNM